MVLDKHGKVHGFHAWLQLVRAYNYLEARISADLRRADLTLARFDVLVVLTKFGPMSQQVLADRLFVTKGNVVGLIDKLSVRGLVELRDFINVRRFHRWARAFNSRRSAPGADARIAACREDRKYLPCRGTSRPLRP